MWLLSGSTKIITGVLARTFFAFFWAAVGVFGLGYYLVSRDPDRNEAVIWTGCLAKVLIFFTFGRLYLRKQITLFGFLGCPWRPHLDHILPRCPARRKGQGDRLT